MASSTKFSDAVHSHRLSTVVPGSLRGATLGDVYELTGGDLSLKLHYLKAVYYFSSSETVRGLTVPFLKKPMFSLLDIYYPAAGRIRRNDAGRPHIKCNDGGVRIVEACCDWTIEEWLQRNEVDRHRCLVPDKVVGPDIYFSPTVFIQFTRFKCGGMAVGLSWAHLLGDALSASNCINLWGQLLSGKETAKNFLLRSLQNDMGKPLPTMQYSVLPTSIKQVKPVGDFWLNPNSRPMATFSIELAAAKLNDLQSKISTKVSVFEVLTALLWKNIAKIREDEEPKLITVCRNSSAERIGILNNLIEVRTVAANLSPANSELPELAKLVSKESLDEMKTIQEIVNREGEKLDVILYGANLTFVDMESINLHGLELKGYKPLHVECSIDGVGDEGAVLVLQGHASTGGRMVSFILPVEEIAQLRELLEKDWGIV